MSVTIGVFVGSLRRDSFCKKVANTFQSLIPEGYEMKFIDISKLQMYNQDYDDDGNTPMEWETFRKEVKELDGFLFVTPEYNRSIPPVLKNALDIASRPYGQNVWSGKPGAVFSVSPGNIGGFGANHHLRQVLSFLNVYTMQQPEVYLSNITNSLDEQGNISNESTIKFLQDIANAFAAWIAKFM
ncbi:NADPH-dependent FMN reductase [Lachnoclostridium phytofermentans]|uniref:NADPH-dependent FMN reductase n=1 Tax=Lachnoclostridium phytofermentans (strain ATCC 700394 / DSM 18823 / ISDg) TaxID=357809 RepID=A9KMP7_LACP7|nr:NAD(P)H-dependent oxidoreductase [Lachnoclostridium phytofermentans]ABX41492.1 NADPH-dependent FMN reductase [Lachnoclostridium phytofermentans ISDg]